MKKTNSFVCLILICSLLFCSCSSFYYDYIDPILFPEEQYYKGANWNCELDEFATTYLELYTQKIEELKTQYQLSFTVECKMEDRFELRSNIISFTLCGDNFKFKFVLNNGVELGYLDTYLFYYYENEEEYKDYSKIAPFLGFINDFTNYAGYDMEIDRNYFEELYFEALNSDKIGASYKHHYDSTVGNVCHFVGLKSQAGISYLEEYEGDPAMYCLNGEFEGILKPLI